MSKVFYFPKRARSKCNSFFLKKKKMLPLVEKQFKIRSRFNSTLHLQKKHTTEKNIKDEKK